MSDVSNLSSVSENIDFKSILKFILPLFIIPITLLAVHSFGHIAGDIIIGIAFFASIVFVAKTQNERRLMIVMSIFAMLFETANVAIGIYKYEYTVQIPVWVAIGWGVLGFYIYKNLPVTKLLSLKNSLILSVILFVLVWVLMGSSFSGANGVVALLIILGSIFVLSKSSSFPHSFYLHMALCGMLIEYLGTSIGVWTYFDPATKIAMGVPLLGLGMAYASVMSFCIWISKLE
jgi:hypothetical protein